MKLTTLGPLALATGSYAIGLWNCMAGCDDGIPQAAMKRAVMIAEVTSRTLGTNLDNQHVKDILGYVFARDQAFNFRIESLKYYHDGIKQYSKTETPMEQDHLVNSDHDLYILGENIFNKDPEQNDLYHNMLHGYHFDEEESKLLEELFDPSQLPEQGKRGIQAMVTTSSRYEMKGFNDALQKWENSNPRPPQGVDVDKYIIPQPDTPEILFFGSNFRTWRKASSDPMHFIKDDGSLEDGLLFLQDDNAMDILGTTAEGIVLHELSHTTLGAIAIDAPRGNCYGWACVKDSHNQQNADTVSFLGVAFYMLEKGWKLQKSGSFKKIT